MVKIWKLGSVNFDTALRIQMALARKHLDTIAKGLDSNCDTLLMVEHSPVYTVGIRDKTPNSEIVKLKSVGADFRKTNRGGLITFHGPGQLVVYPILNLKHFRPSIKCYVHDLEETIIRLCNEIGIVANRSPHTGVWIQDNKIAAIGIHASRYVTTHGICLNCDNDLSWFDHIVPCGIEGKGVTTLSIETSKHYDIEKTIPLFTKHFDDVFGCKSAPVDYKTQEEILSKVYANLMSQIGVQPS